MIEQDSREVGSMQHRRKLVAKLSKELPVLVGVDLVRPPGAEGHQSQ